MFITFEQMTRSYEVTDGSEWPAAHSMESQCNKTEHTDNMLTYLSAASIESTNIRTGLVTMNFTFMRDNTNENK
jgi:hypothetical protein